MSNVPSDRLQNSPYFCLFKYVRAVEQKVWNEAETDSETGERRFLGRVRLTSRFTGFFTDFEKKPTVLPSTLQIGDSPLPCHIYKALFSCAGSAACEHEHGRSVLSIHYHNN